MIGLGNMMVVVVVMIVMMMVMMGCSRRRSMFAVNIAAAGAVVRIDDIRRFCVMPGGSA